MPPRGRCPWRRQYAIHGGAIDPAGFFVSMVVRQIVQRSAIKRLSAAPERLDHLSDLFHIRHATAKRHDRQTRRELLQERQLHFKASARGVRRSLLTTCGRSCTARRASRSIGTVAEWAVAKASGCPAARGRARGRDHRTEHDNAPDDAARPRLVRHRRGAAPARIRYSRREARSALFGSPDAAQAAHATEQVIELGSEASASRRV